MTRNYCGNGLEAVVTRRQAIALAGIGGVTVLLAGCSSTGAGGGSGDGGSGSGGQTAGSASNADAAESEKPATNYGITRIEYMNWEGTDCVREFSYDGHGSVLSATQDTDGGETTFFTCAYSYDDEGRLATAETTYEDGHTRSYAYAYDDQDRVTRIDYAYTDDDERGWTHEYDYADDGSNLVTYTETEYRDGSLVSSNSVTCSQDDAITSRFVNTPFTAYPIVTDQYSSSDEYDGENRLVSRTYKNGAVTTYEYGEDGKRSRETTYTPASAIGTVYDEVTDVTYERSYDDAGKLTSEVTTTTDSSIRDPTTNSTTETEGIITKTVTYTYNDNGDPLSKVTETHSELYLSVRVPTLTDQIEDTTSSVTYEYDDHGNFLSKTTTDEYGDTEYENYEYEYYDSGEIRHKRRSNHQDSAADWFYDEEGTLVVSGSYSKEPSHYGCEFATNRYDSSPTVEGGIGSYNAFIYGNNPGLEPADDTDGGLTFTLYDSVTSNSRSPMGTVTVEAIGG